MVIIDAQQKLCVLMTDKNNLKQLFKYDLWANKRIGDTLQSQLFDSSQKCTNSLAHIGAAQQMWYARIKDRSTTDIELWPQNGYTDDPFQMLKEKHRQWITLLAKNKGKLDKEIVYKNSKGTQFSTPLRGILHHIIIHGQHHRAQIALLLRQSGVDPPGTDFIFYLRNK